MECFRMQKAAIGGSIILVHPGINVLRSHGLCMKASPHCSASILRKGRGASVIEKFTVLIKAKGRNAILIGHSVGGLVVQSLINSGFGSLGICVSSVAPNRMLSFDWGFFRNSISIVNPFMGDEPFIMTPEGFYQNFCNTMTQAAARIAYEQTATRDSRNVLRDCMRSDGELDLELTGKPLLFIGG